MKHKGFTLIEIALFIAITGMLFVGIVVGTANSIAGQRFADSVQSFTEFLRGVYAEVANPQSVGEGRSNVAIYGKLISFGQRCGLNGNVIDSDVSCNNDDMVTRLMTQRIYVYDVVGRAAEASEMSGSVKELLKNLDANVVVGKYRNANGTEQTKLYEPSNTLIGVEPAGIVETYTPRWNATIETTASNYVPFTGSILIVRHPNSGTINTLVYAGDDGIVQVNRTVKVAMDAISVGGSYDVSGLLRDKLAVNDGFKVAEVDFCVDTEGMESTNQATAVARPRRDIRLVENARNVSGVEVIALDDFDESDDGIRNKCMPEQ